MAKETTIFTNGASQAVRIPKEMRFSGDKVLIDRIGSVMIILDPADPWAGLRLAQLIFAGNFMNEGRQINPLVHRPGLTPEDESK